MKHLVFILTLILTPIALSSQTEVLINARPLSMGYCTIAGSECKEFINIAGEEVSGYLLCISFKKKEVLKVTLYRNGELIEELFSTGFNRVRSSKKEFSVSCSTFQWNKLFHNPEGSDSEHSLTIDISLKRRTGKISFYYPHQSRIYIYRINLL